MNSENIKNSSPERGCLKKNNYEDDSPELTGHQGNIYNFKIMTKIYELDNHILIHAAYLIYQRVMNVYSKLFQGKTVTEAAHEAGFSGSAHFADVNRRLFGLPVREITRDVTFVKVK